MPTGKLKSSIKGAGYLLMIGPILVWGAIFLIRSRVPELLGLSLVACCSVSALCSVVPKEKFWMAFLAGLGFYGTLMLDAEVSAMATKMNATHLDSLMIAQCILLALLPVFGAAFVYLTIRYIPPLIKRKPADQSSA